jgi:arylsulfatase
MKHLSLLFFLLLGTGLQVAWPQQPNRGRRPNIVLIMADDLGFSDIGCYGGEIHTPNIDWLAANGIRFSSFYNTSRCCPSRAALLTGQYNHRAGIGHMTDDEDLPGYRGYLTDNTVTIAEVLKSAGYHTAMSGKWHVSNTSGQPTPAEQLQWLQHHAEHPLFSPLSQYPTSRGFEKYFGNIWGVVDYFDPFALVSGTTPVQSVPPGYYHTDAINDTAVAYINQLSKLNKPFFLYVAETAPHWPLMALPQDIEKYKDTYREGWDSIRVRRYRRMIDIGLIDPIKAPLSPRQDNQLDWKDNPDSIWDARAMAVHAAMIDRMDQGIGRIIAALRANGELDNTLILFLSDNGASPENCAAYGPGFDRPAETRDGRKIIYDVRKQVLPGAETTYTSIGMRWANVANTPYRYAKAESYEGGIHTPMLAFWPAGITAVKGSTCRQTAHVMDFMATFLELAGTSYPTTFNTHPITALQGVSLLAAFKGKKGKTHEALFNEHFGARYVRVNDWKLVARNNEQWKLYHISEDETELHDLFGQYPAMVIDLEKRWKDWASKNNVLPAPAKK